MGREHSPTSCAGQSSPATCIRDIFRHQNQPFRTGTCSRVIKHHGDSLGMMSVRDEWIKKKWHIDTMEYHVPIKRNENFL